jgi:hypothetical protein
MFAAALMIEALVSHNGKAHIDQICAHVANVCIVSQPYSCWGVSCFIYK